MPAAVRRPDLPLQVLRRCEREPVAAALQVAGPVLAVVKDLRRAAHHHFEGGDEVGQPVDADLLDHHDETGMSLEDPVEDNDPRRSAARSEILPAC